MIPSLALLFGVVVFGVVLQDAFEVMLLPRRVQRPWRIVSLYYRGSWGVWRVLARTQPPGARRERFLSIFGALSMMLLFTLWASALIVAFGFLQWGLERTGGARSSSPLGDQIYLSGVTFFTLGYGDVAPKAGLARAAAVVEAGVGLGLMAVVIGYLPVLYQLFSRREAHVLQLDARAGSPPTALVLLNRHAESDGLDRVDEILRSWELWCAELLESHLSYPMLAYYRSQHDDQSWLAALTAIMDACALILVGVEAIRPLQARMTFAMARQVVVEMARSLSVSATRSEHERLSGPAYQTLIESFSMAGLVWNPGEGGEETLLAIRATYEPLLQGLADHLLLPLPGWIPEAGAGDHWDRGPRGLIARRLIEGLAEGTLPAPRSASGGRSRAERLRDRLR